MSNAKVHPQASRWQELSWQACGMGMLAALVGYTGSFAVVLQGLRAAGANDGQAVEGLIALSLSMGLTGIILGWRYRMPIGVAWSLPGAALLASSGGTLSSVNEATGAYILCALLLLTCGLIRPVGRMMEAIPSSLANAMLAGILLPICLTPVQALAEFPSLAIVLIGTWWFIGRFNRLLAVPVALVALLVFVLGRDGIPASATLTGSNLITLPSFIAPTFSLPAFISISLPLFVVTMASQNLPGIAVLRANGYSPKAGPLISNTALFSLFSAPFGGHAVNLAAVTAAMMASPESHSDPNRRYWAAICAGASYILLGLFSGVIGLLFVVLPPTMITAIAGLALLTSFGSAIVGAFADDTQREAAILTFLFAASGLAFLGVGAAFWGLLIGAAVLFVNRLMRNAKRTD